MAGIERSSSNNIYHLLRAFYLGISIPFELKKSIKNMCFEAISPFWGDADFLREWSAQRKFDQRARSLFIDGKRLYGGEDELHLYSLAREWESLLNLSKKRIIEDLIPRMQRMIRASHLCKPISPRASIIIPAHGSPLYTLTCIHSLIKQETVHPFDIHIADDNPDDTRLSGYITRLESAQIHYHRNARNLGFTLNVNLASSRCLSELIIFLNNDTYCHPLWLENLVSTYDRLSKKGQVGAIGSKVLHRNLHIQESGCLLHPGGHPIPLGRGEHAFNPQFSYLREVDFVSACSMLVEREMFTKLGGFDERFSPGYYEDPELCERLKANGATNYVQPSSCLIHEEGASFGKDGFSKVKDEKLILFNALHPSPISIEQQFQAKPRLLYIDAYLPMPDKGSGSIDAMAFVEYFLSRGYRITFYAHHHNNYFEKYTRALETLGVEVLQDQFQSLTSFLDNKTEAIDFFFVSRYYQIDFFWSLIKSKLSNSRLIYNTVDLHFLREEREAAIYAQIPPYERHLDELKKKELSYISMADTSIVISAYELDLLHKLLPNTTSVHHVPQCRPFIGTKEPYAMRSGLVFIGSAHQPNVDALRYFQSELHPLLVQKLPNYKLSVIGQELQESLSRHGDVDIFSNPNVNFLGYIENVTPILHRAQAMIVPLRFGSGIKGKVVQAIQHSLPCISTEIGVEGLELPYESSVLVSNTPRDFVSHIISLCTDQLLWEKHSRLAQQTFENRFSSEIFIKRMDILMDELCQKDIK
jgi:GT2 family glycosyltransferase